MEDERKKREYNCILLFLGHGCRSKESLLIKGYSESTLEEMVGLGLLTKETRKDAIGENAIYYCATENSKEIW